MALSVRRLVTWFLMALAVALVGAQVIPVERTNPPSDPGRTMAASLAVPAHVASALDRSCRDCHTNNTRWPWYSRVAPMSWLLAGHVREGREHLNLSEWAGYSRERMNEKLEKMCEETREGEMPLPSYLLLHRASRLNPVEIDGICTWTASARASLQPRP